MSTVSEEALAFSKEGREAHRTEVHEFIDAVMAIAKAESRKVRSLRAIQKYISDKWPEGALGRESLVSYLEENHNDEYERFYKKRG